MKSKVGIIFISITIALLVIILAMLVNHLICRDGNAPQTLIRIDEKVVGVINSAKNSITGVTDYIKYVFKKATAIKTPEYPSDYLPLYPESSVTSYTFNETTNTLKISVGTKDTLNVIYDFYNSMFINDITVDYFKQFKDESNYSAYGMIGNFTFLLEAIPNDDEKYEYQIKTQLHYLINDELAMENFYRQQNVADSYIFTNPYIHLYQKDGDESYIYLQLIDYKSQLLDIDTHVELYINDEFYSSRYYGDTIRIPLSALNKMQNIKMISFDNNECIRAVDILEDLLIYNAYGQTDLYELTENYNKVRNLFIINSESIEDISYFNYFTNLESLYFEGNSEIDNYSSLLYLKDLSALHLKNVNDNIINELHELASLTRLEISDSKYDIYLGENFNTYSCKELKLSNCSNIIFDEYGLLSLTLERLDILYNYSIDSLEFISVYPNLRVLNLSNCDNLSTLISTDNLPNLNVITINNCQEFDFSQPLDNSPSLMNVKLTSNSSFSKINVESLQSIWTNNNLVVFEVNNCIHAEDIIYYDRPWYKEN